MISASSDKHAQSNSPILVVDNLHAGVNDKTILNGISITVNPGEVHAIMGPNGSGKSTLSKILVGHPDFEMTAGSVTYLGEDLSTYEPDERALRGIFLAFQYPVEIPGVNNAAFLRMAYNAKMVHQGKEELDPLDFAELLEEKAKLVEMDADLLNQRAVNEGFSGGEKKRNEILQMAVLEPTLAVLDETDSGLDIDALRIVASGVNSLRSPNNGMIIVTHYQRLLNYIEPDFVHVLANGKIIRSGDKVLAHELEEKGYDWLLNEPSPAA
ncbi:MAG: Fe-S cluster assembly ATPase SufC [Cyanobacteria bacterium P01_H01_bin.74]